MIGDQDLVRMFAETRRLRRGFAATAPREWDALTAGAELLVQLGHLAVCLARARGDDVSAVDDPARPIVDVGDELADVVLAILSIAVLADSAPQPPCEGSVVGYATVTGDEEITGFLGLTVAAGRLVEVAMVTGGYRHRPAGRMPSVAAAYLAAVAAADRLADMLDLDLAAEFDAMAVDAHRFLDHRRDADQAIARESR